MSEDSKNVFRIDVSHIETHCKPIKVLVSISTVIYSREAENVFASKMAETNFLLYKMKMLDPILKKLSFYLQKQKSFYSNPSYNFGKHVNFHNLYLSYYKKYFAIDDRMIISSDLESATSFYITKNSF